MMTSGRTSFRTLAITAIVATSAIHWAAAEPLRSGSYEITARLELPHLERWAVDRTIRICLPHPGASGGLLVPVVSANTPFDACTPAHVAGDGATLQYDIVCPGRASASAHATYVLAGDAFTGHIAMVMGAKNMTMTEVQHARRVGDCSPRVSQSAPPS